MKYIRRRSFTVHRGIKHVAMFWVILVLVVVPFEVIWAQDGEGTPATTGEAAEQTDSDIPLVHVVQEGETLFVIAEQYGTTIDTLQILNNISDPSLLFVGQQLVIPGGGGDVVASVHTVRIGDTLFGIAAEFNTTEDRVASSNGVISPDRLVAGRPLTVISRTGTAERQALTGIPYNVSPGDTLLTIAAEYGLSPLDIVELNQLSYPAFLVPGQRLRLPGEELFQYLPTPWKRVELAPVSINQGDSAAIYVESTLPGMPFGWLAGQTLQFASYHDGYLALAGLDAFTESGLHELRLDGAGDQPWQPFSQQIDLRSSGYGVQYIDVPDELSALLAPEIRADEDAFLATIYTRFTDEVLWDGPFSLPITGTVISAAYGDGRSYDQGPVEIFHTGIDFVGFVGTPIFAPAAGTVIFSDTLQIRGNTLILDHGLGLMSGYYHLSAIHVGIGDIVEAGQHIADGGSTGLSTGPHLHWDMRILNAAVNGLQWVEEDIVLNLAQ